MTRIKTFRPKPLSSGARIDWLHFAKDGSRTVRSGVVRDRAPSVEGAVVVCWVIADEPAPGDLYRALAVGKSTRHQPVFGTERCHPGDPWVDKHTLFSSDEPDSPLGSLMSRCWTRFEPVRSGRENRSLGGDAA